MKSDYLVAALLAGAVAIGLGANSVHSSDKYCPNPSAASVDALFAPCQAFDSAMGHSVSKQEAAQIGWLRPDLQPEPAAQLAHNLRSAPLPLPQAEKGTVGLAKPGPKAANP